jgi:hypothetical protein
MSLVPIYRGPEDRRGFHVPDLWMQSRNHGWSAVKKVEKRNCPPLLP